MKKNLIRLIILIKINKKIIIIKQETSITIVTIITIITINSTNHIGINNITKKKTIIRITIIIIVKINTKKKNQK